MHGLSSRRSTDLRWTSRWTSGTQPSTPRRRRSCWAPRSRPRSCQTIAASSPSAIRPVAALVAGSRGWPWARPRRRWTRWSGTSRSPLGAADLLVAVWAQPGRIAVEDFAGAVEQVRVHAAAGKEPMPGDAVATRHDDRAAPLSGRAGGDADGLAEEQLAADLRRQLRALA